MITKEQFDSFPTIIGYKMCPTGDYSMLSKFTEGCKFAEGCRFVEGCSFAEGCKFAEGCSFENGRTPNFYNKPFFAVDRIGMHNRKVYFFDFKEGFYIRAGCFFGTENELLEKLKKDDDLHKSKVYKMSIKLAKLQLQKG